jgi:hypothetical protein
MVVIFVIGVLVDSLVFGQIERRVLVKRGLRTDASNSPATTLRRRDLVGAAFAR